MNGRPGIKPTVKIKKLAIATVFGFPRSCSERSLLRTSIKSSWIHSTIKQTP